jgi:hypothetical protein
MMNKLAICLFTILLLAGGLHATNKDIALTIGATASRKMFLKQSAINKKKTKYNGLLSL